MKLGIPVLNRGDLLGRLVRSIGTEAEVLLVVNRIGAVDATVEEAAAALEAAPPDGVRVAVARIAGNLGVAGSWNRIVEHFGGGCWLVNSDIAFTPGVLREAMAQVERQPEVLVHHLWSAACFYVTEQFSATAGWFDENFYPAYCEDQEIGLRCERLGVRRTNIQGLNARVSHEGSQTIRSAAGPQRRFIEEAHEMGRAYLHRRWGALPPPGGRLPEKRTPFADPSWHPADWTLDLAARSELARLCEAITGAECPVVWHRARGGLG